MEVVPQKLQGDIIRVETPERAINWVCEDNARVIQEQNIQIISVDNLKKLQEAELCVFEEKPTVGMVLARHPFRNDTFVELDKLEEEMFRYRKNALTRIVTHLGITKIESSIHITEKMTCDTSIQGSIQFKLVSLDAEYKNQQEENYKKEYTRKHEFKNPQTDYNQAVKIAQETNLWGDDDIRTLIECRNPNQKASQLTHESHKITLSKELNNRLKVAANLNFLPIFKLSGEYKKTVNTLQTVVMILDLQFD